MSTSTPAPAVHAARFEALAWVVSWYKRIGITLDTVRKLAATGGQYGQNLADLAWVWEQMEAAAVAT